MAEDDNGKEAPAEAVEGEGDTPKVMENGGSASSEVNVPQPMRRYVVAFRRTLHGRSQPPLHMLMSPDAAGEEMSAEGHVGHMLSIGPEDLREIQETFNVHSIEELLETLKMKEEELVRIKSDFSIKMRNSLALQRIKFEKELSDMKKRMEEFSEYTDAEEFLKKREEEIKR